MICTTCGRDNPSHLVFCQECGQRLAPRVAPPTPPIGLSAPAQPVVPATRTSPLAATALPPQSAGVPSAPNQALARPPTQRPLAPDVYFAPREPAPPQALPAPPQAFAPPPAAPDTITCPLCASVNQRGLRFCVTCGHLLAQLQAAPQPAHAQPAIVAAAPEVPRKAPAVDLSRTAIDPQPLGARAAEAAAPIAPARVVELGSPAQPAMQRLCARCRGASPGDAQFCRFCGASLADATPVALQPSPDPIATPAPALVAPSPPAERIVAAAAAPVAAAPAPAPAPVAPAPTPAGTVALAPSAAPIVSTTRGRLVLIARDGGEGPSYSIGDTADIGRTEGNVVVADDRYVSPRHARIAWRAGAFVLRDLGSTNGVYVRIPFESFAVGGSGSGPEPASLGEQPLADQDLFLVGQQVLRFDVVKHAEEGFGVAEENGTLVFGTPAAPRLARLSQRTVEGVARDVFYLRKSETIIGRESGDIVFTDDPFLSRRHAAVRVQTTQQSGAETRRFTLVDLGSSNFTFLRIRDEVRLRHGDHFRIGQQLFRIDLDARPGA